MERTMLNIKVVWPLRSLMSGECAILAPVPAGDVDALPLNQPTVSHHLRILRDAGLVTCARRGTWVYYRLAEDARKRLHAAFTIALPERVMA